MNAVSFKHIFVNHYPVAGLIVALLFHAAYVYAPCDDAYIYLVYVQSFLEGKGLTYNGDAVQGFTSILWPWLITLASILPIELPRAMEALSLLSAIFVLVASYAIGIHLNLSRTQAVLPVIVLTFTGDFAFYAGNGLETLSFAGMILVVVSFLFHTKPQQVLRENKLPIAILFLILLRPEGVLVAAIIVGWLIYTSKALFDGLRLVLKLLVILLPVLVILKMTYGDYLPVTYYAKSGAGLANLYQGIEYSENFAKYYFPIPILLCLTFILRWKRIGKPALPIALLLLIWIAQVTIQGGDNMVGFRMYLPIMPVALFTIVYAFRDISIKLTFAAAAGTAGYLFLIYNVGTIIAAGWQPYVRQHAQFWRDSYLDRKAVGLWLKATFPSDTKVALSSAGIIPYYSRLPTIDMLGLNNRFIALYGRRDRSLGYAHQSGDGIYVLSQNPGVIFIEGRTLVSTREILQDYRLKQDYILCKATEIRGAWVRRDLVLEAMKHGITLTCLNS